jgi:8-oxo-dGTP diphosphatase
MEQFGKPLPDRTPQDRPGAYGVTLGEGRLLVVEFQRRLYLPGGALLEGEVPEETLRREVLEETGHEIARAVPLGQAKQYVKSSEGYFNKTCAFFALEVGPKVRNYYSPGHSPEWVSIDDAVPMFAEEASLWAVQRYLDLHRD